MGQNTQADARTPGGDALAVVAGDGPREYSEAERVTIVLLATLVGVAEAARIRDVPASTIYDWLAKLGGVQALREAASDTLAATMHVVAIELCMEIRKRAPDMSDKAQVEALRVMVASGARGPADDQAGRSRQPTAPILIQFNNGDTIPIPADLG